MQQHDRSMSTVGRTRPLLLAAALLALLLVAGCNDAEEPVLPTPNVNVLVPTATALTARIEVVVVVVTPTPAPTATPAASGEKEATAPAAASPTRAQSDGGQVSNQELVDQGEGIFGEECATCHQADGQGSGSYPALAGSGILTGDDPTQAVQYVLNGPGEMPSFEDTLSNQQIAAVLSYARNAWSNDAAAVSVAQVRQVRNGGSASAGSNADTTIFLVALTLCCLGFLLLLLLVFVLWRRSRKRREEPSIKDFADDADENS